MIGSQDIYLGFFAAVAYLVSFTYMRRANGLHEGPDDVSNKATQASELNFRPTPKIGFPETRGFPFIDGVHDTLEERSIYVSEGKLPRMQCCA